MAVRKESAEGAGWIEISVDIHPTAHEALSAFLFDLGCEGVVSEDFGKKTLRGYLPPAIDPLSAKAQIRLFLDRLKEIFPQVLLPEPVFRRLEQEDWELKWRRFFRADRITPNLLVLPAWESPPERAEGHVLLIDPGPAFGTGRHPTTRMCLRAMEKMNLRHPWTMLDVGTGSGILSIYGAMLGASRITAVDLDPEALRWASRNIELNHCPEVIEVSNRPIEELQERFALLAANLTLDPILELLPYFSRLLEPGGRLILSGILTEQKAEVQASLPLNSLRQDDEFQEEEWACLVGSRV